MPENIPDKNVEVNGKIIGANSIIKLNMKTALWVITGIVAAVMFILSYSYFDLKAEVKEFQEVERKHHEEFIEKVEEKMEKVDENIHAVKVDQATIKGDIRLILDRQTRDNPIKANPNVSLQSVEPPK